MTYQYQNSVIKPPIDNTSLSIHYIVDSDTNKTVVYGGGFASSIQYYRNLPTLFDCTSLSSTLSKTPISHFLFTESLTPVLPPDSLLTRGLLTHPPSVPLTP